MLSARAHNYLASLQRVEAVPVATLKARLEALGQEAPAPWLDFQERYAGYVEPLGAEQAVWGLVHLKPRWARPLEPELEKSYENGAVWFATCADVHPSYVYRLGDNGFFTTQDARDFDVKVERNAARLEFLTMAGRRAKLQFDPQAPELLKGLEGAAVVPEASDDFYRLRVGARALALEETPSGRIVEGWTLSG
jgi:hypothetical protein